MLNVPPGCLKFKQDLESNCEKQLKDLAVNLANKTDVSSILAELRGYKDAFSQNGAGANVGLQIRNVLLNVLTDLQENKTLSEMVTDVIGINDAYVAMFLTASIIIAVMALISMMFGFWQFCCFIKRKFLKCQERKALKKEELAAFRLHRLSSKYTPVKTDSSDVKRKPSRRNSANVVSDHLVGAKEGALRISPGSGAVDEGKKDADFSENKFLRERISQADQEICELQMQVKKYRENEGEEML